jgi:hypothetical protein
VRGSFSCCLLRQVTDSRQYTAIRGGSSNTHSAAPGSTLTFVWVNSLQPFHPVRQSGAAQQVRVVGRQTATGLIQAPLSPDGRVGSCPYCPAKKHAPAPNNPHFGECLNRRAGLGSSRDSPQTTVRPDVRGSVSGWLGNSMTIRRACWPAAEAARMTRKVRRWRCGYEQTIARTTFDWGSTVE